MEPSRGDVIMGETLSDNAKKIKQQIAALIELQMLDDEINQRRVQIEKLNRKVAEEVQKIGQLKSVVQEQRSQTDRLLKDRRNAEGELKQKQEQIQKLGGQLFEVKTNEAYQALQSEINQKKQENSLLEERILEMMVQEDETKARIQSGEAEHQKVEQTSLDQQNQYRQEIAALEQAIAGYRQQWESASRAVQPEYLDLYQRLRNAKGGKAMAKIENNICSGCRLSIRPQATIELKKYRSLLYCDNCARILYAD